MIGFWYNNTKLYYSLVLNIFHLPNVQSDQIDVEYGYVQDWHARHTAVTQLYASDT